MLYVLPPIGRGCANQRRAKDRQRLMLAVGHQPSGVCPSSSVVLRRCRQDGLRGPFGGGWVALAFAGVYFPLGRPSCFCVWTRSCFPPRWGSKGIPVRLQSGPINSYLWRTTWVRRARGPSLVTGPSSDLFWSCGPSTISSGNDSPSSGSSVACGPSPTFPGHMAHSRLDWGCSLSRPPPPNGCVSLCHSNA